MDATIARSLQALRPISLARLNEKAAMLERLDHKYIVPADDLHFAWPRLAEMFDVLDIDGRRSFRYATRYYDDRSRRSYFDHHQGRRKRCKVRVRNYVDAGLSYLEVKLKDRRDATIKKRLKLDAARGTLDAAGVAFVAQSYQDLYGEPFDQQLRPVLAMRYKRVTLVARRGGERMTLDTALEFLTPDCRRAVDPALFIIETKSARGNGIADRILRDLPLHPTRRCSKYCVGMAATGQVTKHNRFLPALRRLGLIGPRTPPRQTEELEDAGLGASRNHDRRRCPAAAFPSREARLAMWFAKAQPPVAGRALTARAEAPGPDMPRG